MLLDDACLNIMEIYEVKTCIIPCWIVASYFSNLLQKTILIRDGNRLGEPGLVRGSQTGRALNRTPEPKLLPKLNLVRVPLVMCLRHFQVASYAIPAHLHYPEVTCHFWMTWLTRPRIGVDMSGAEHLNRTLVNVWGRLFSKLRFGVQKPGKVRPALWLRPVPIPNINMCSETPCK
ncbi:UNVERIFIED_CONTAM: hypothetical protein K2H54_051296 [Gekko kuhli]